jgi:hypothetical protein
LKYNLVHFFNETVTKNAKQSKSFISSFKNKFTVPNSKTPITLPEDLIKGKQQIDSFCLCYIRVGDLWFPFSKNELKTFELFSFLLGESYFL